MREWNRLRGFFSEPESVLIFHLVNHYCPIYAMREYWTRGGDTAAQSPSDTSAEGGAEDGDVDEEGEEDADCGDDGGVGTSASDDARAGGGGRAHVMEIFVSRRGQRVDSAEWISFHEVRRVLLRWAGYGVLQVKREDVVK